MYGPNTINFNSPPISYYDLDLNPNVKALINLPTQATLYFTNNGDNVFKFIRKIYIRMWWFYS